MLAILNQTAKRSATMFKREAVIQFVSNPEDREAETKKSAEQLHQLFEQSCDVFRERTAVICNNQEVSYAELDRRANQLARYLISWGIKPGDRVGILLQRSFNTYVSLLAIVKARAVFVPMDIGFPAGRIRFITRDAGLAALITTSDLVDIIPDLSCPLIQLDTTRQAIDSQRSGRIRETELHHPFSGRLCYIIYTSGSTGNPKGVAIEHPSICNFVQIAADVYDIRKTDRVYQGMTIAFDFSIEEIWLGLIRGAAIVAGPNDERRLGRDLADFLIEHRVTVMGCVPTLLATIDKDIPTLRTLIVGGESCPQNLVERWSRPGRRMLNTYGPTETTVTATWGEMFPGKPVTIGRAMPTYTIYILDKAANPVADGEIGEICIGGIGLARGYINREEQTRKSFIPDPLNTPENPSGRIYRTGDLGRRRQDGEIEYLGRIDTQVKIRGYRIELTEIESVILESPEVRKVAVASYRFGDENQELVAYCELKSGFHQLDREQLHSRLSSRLPAYMIPAWLEVIEKIPMLPNGKTDRKRLPAPIGQRLGSGSTKFVAPANRIEQNIANELARLLNLERVSVTDDFFLDLGGHSLIVARLVSKLRDDPAMTGLGLSDLYSYPTIRRLADYIAQQQAAEPEQSTEHAPEAKNSKVWLCGALQVLSIWIVTALYALPGLLILDWMVDNINWNQPDFRVIAGLSCLGVLLFLVLSLVFSVVLKWLLLGRIQPGSYPLYGWYFLRLWVVDKAMAAAPLPLLSGTPLLTFYFRLLGARIGRDVVLATPLIHLPDLVTIGDGTSVNTGTHVFGYTAESGMMHLSPVYIGRNCCVGSNSVLMPGACMEDEAVLGDQSLLGRQSTVPAGESWNGSPAGPDTRKKRKDGPAPVTPARNISKPVQLALFFIGSLVISLVPLVAAVPATISSRLCYRYFGNLWFLIAAPIAALTFVVTLSGLVVVLKKMVLPAIRAGRYSVASVLYVRKWFVDRLMELSLGLTNSLYATLYLAPFLRLLGAKIGRLAEISTISHVTPDLLIIDDESFVADIAHVGPIKIEKNCFSVSPVRIGKRSFVGNSAFVPGNTCIGDNSLIGVLSLPPEQKVAAGTTWLGSPPIHLPEREPSREFPEHLTFAPTPDLYARRLGYEYFRITLPLTLSFLASIGLFFLSLHLLSIFSIPFAALMLAQAMMGMGLLLAGVVAGMKKIVVGTYQPRIRPMWSSFVWRTELITALYENITVPWLLARLTGTPFMAPVLRLLGAKIGKRCFMETTFLTEFDLVEIGNDCCIGQACSLQTHLFEDRVMKMSRLRIGNRCSIGPRAVILYDAVLEDDVILDGLTLVMKGETVPASSCWHGAPATKWKIRKQETLS